MSWRIKSGLSLLLMALVFAASSQAAVCELACGIGAQSIGCHSTGASMKEEVPTPEMPVMSHSHCMPAMRGHGVQAKSAVHAGANLTDLHETRCYHRFAPAIAGAFSTDLDLAAIYWTIVEVVPIAAMVPDTHPVVHQYPPPSYTAARSLLVTLRV